MSESSQPSKQDPVRIVYHTGNRTFARLFNGDITSHHGHKTRLSSLHVERSLEEVKDVVRRKLGLGRETDVSLRQMIASDALLDLEDGESKKKSLPNRVRSSLNPSTDDDFQAFRVLLRSSVSVDIQVTVGRSQGSAVPPPVSSVS